MGYWKVKQIIIQAISILVSKGDVTLIRKIQLKLGNFVLNLIAFRFSSPPL